MSELGRSSDDQSQAFQIIPVIPAQPISLVNLGKIIGNVKIPGNARSVDCHKRGEIKSPDIGGIILRILKINDKSAADGNISTDNIEFIVGIDIALLAIVIDALLSFII